jgi:Flp pilus assembly protein TadB
MAEDQKQRAVSRARRSVSVGQHEQARMENANNNLVRVCMIGFGTVIVVIAPVVWIWKIPLFLLIMFVVGVLMPAIRRARRNPH